MTRVVGNDDRMRSAARKAVSRADRLCLLREGAQRTGDRSRRLPRDSEDPDDVSEKTVSGRCIGYRRGTDKTLGRRNGQAWSRSGFGDGQRHSRG